MKKILSISVLLTLGFGSLWADLKPRYFEWGLFNVDFGLGNNFLSWSDIINPSHTIKIDLDKLPRKAFGIEADGEIKTWFNIQTTGKYQVGVNLSAGVEMVSFSGLSKKATEFLSEGSGGSTSITGSVEAGASIFGTVELKGSAKVGRWKFFAAPGIYLPLLYMRQPSIRYELDSADPIKGEVVINADLYTAFNAKAFMDDSDITGIADPIGADLSLGAEYALFDWLNVGGTITHLPILPAFMKNSTSISMEYDINPNEMELTDLIDDGFDDFFDDVKGFDSDDPDVYHTGLHHAVFRPLRFDIYGVYKPFKKDSITLKPRLGFSVLTVYGACFNMDVTARANWKNFVSVDLSTGYRERLWRNKIILAFNLRALELDLGIGLQSQSFLRSFTLRGLNAALGLRLGW
jgi:hypothetical protein